MDATQPTTALCDWCGVNPAQRPNGECDDCWHMPGHEGEHKPTLEDERHEEDFRKLREFVERVAHVAENRDKELEAAPYDDDEQIDKVFVAAKYTLSNLGKEATALLTELSEVK